jgi:predicted secreted Zn-dependent protease
LSRPHDRRRAVSTALVIGLATILVACGQTTPSAQPSTSIVPAPNPDHSAPVESPASPAAPSASASPAAELLPIAGTWRVRKILSPKDRSGLVAGRSFDEETYRVTPGCDTEPCSTVEVTTTPLGLASPAKTVRLSRTGATYASRESTAESTDCSNFDGDRVAGGATATTKLTLWIATDRPAGTSVSSTVLRGEIELDLKPTSIGQSAGCEPTTAAFDLSGRREAVAIRDADGDTELPDLKPPRGAVFVRLPKLSASVPNAAVHYFSISGDTAAELVVSVARGGAKACGAIDYEWFRGDNRPSACTLTYPSDTTDAIQTRLRGDSCTVASARVGSTYAIYIPRWTAPARVPKRLLDWWRKVVDFIATHEAGHVRIGREYMRRLNARLVGIDCDQVDAVIQAWAKEHAAAQEAYDRSEYSKPWPQPASGY